MPVQLDYSCIYTGPMSHLVRNNESSMHSILLRIHITNKLEKVAAKYGILGDVSKGKMIWVKFKWSVDFSSVDSLRNKVHPIFFVLK